NDAEKHRRLRDELNGQTKEWKAKRDVLNSKVRELVDEAGKCREERDSFNQKVRETKVVRDEWNQKVTALKEQISVLRPEKPSEDKSEVSVKQLKKQLQDLEYTQQTKSLGKDKENEIVKQISVIARQIDEREKTLEQSGEVKEVIYQLREAKIQAEASHRQVSEHAEAAQSAHDRMLKLYDEADTLRKEADAAQAKFIECKQAADEEHRKHIDQIKSVHEMDKDVAGIKNKKTAAKKKKVDTESKKEAKEIFERFKAGEKLSTDNLMALQKSGYL
ncbi:MAG: phosphoserine phosphatase, partial [Candidatus Methanoplasma sp.]|nr:phosphoserine phosphatase [Candidatus Methanoplasma sp.]